VLEARIAELRERANKEVAPLAVELRQKTTQIELFAESNRASLVGEEKKSIVLPAGEFGWRFTPPKITFGKGGAKKVLALLQSLRLKEYIRTTYEVDREALLRDRPQVKGVKYTQDELFYIKPHTEKEPDFYPGTKAQALS
jgi:phage host-nuclease inhibitor protein Gam